MRGRVYRGRTLCSALNPHFFIDFTLNLHPHLLSQELCDGTSTAWKDQWLLVPHANASTACNYGKLLDNAKANSALGVIVYAQEGTVPAEMGSLPSDGWPPQNVHGTMISYAGTGRRICNTAAHKTDHHDMY